MKRIFFCLPFIGALIGCSAPGQQQKLNAECYVRYLAPEAQLRAEATFRESGPGKNALQPVTLPDGVRYQKVLMGAAAAPAGMYRMERSGGYAPHHVFAWKSPAGQPCTFEMDLAPVTAFTFGADTLLRSKPAEFRWDGAPLEQGESLVFMWENTHTGETVPMEVVGMAGQQSIAFPAAQLAKLPPGNWSLYLVRKKIVQADANGAAVKAVAEYYTNVDTLLIR